MTANKAINTVDKVMDEIQSLRNVMGSGFQSRNNELTTRCDSLYENLASINQHLDAALIDMEDMLRIGTRVIDFIWNVVFAVLGIFIAIILVHLH
jgi:hypothetical protein